MTQPSAVSNRQLDPRDEVICESVLRMRVNLYYREKCGLRFDEGYTEWTLVLSNVTTEEALLFAARFDWSRADWNTVGIEHLPGGVA
jgi:hypothetical protein